VTSPAEAQLPAAATTNAVTDTVAGAESNSAPCFNVTTYVVQDNALLPTNVWFPVLSKYTGTNVSLGEIVKGAEDLQSVYLDHGYTTTSIAIAQDQITNGVVTLNIFQTAIPQIVVSGVRYYAPTNAGIASSLPAMTPPFVPSTTSAPEVTNTPPPSPLSQLPAPQASPTQIAEAHAALLKEMARLDAEKPDTMIHVVSTNAGPRFNVEHYVISGNSVLSWQTIAATLTNIDGAFGTNVSFQGVKTVVEQLQKAYHNRGYATVAVTLPQQKLANATVKIQVLEGRLAAINVVGNNFFSSNNVMRALPGLHTNIVIDAPVLQAELNRANGNQDRQIIPVVGPGPEPGTSVLTLRVKDRLPLHGKVDLDNQSSPGTPELRVNTSAVYNNLWQQEHSLGVQYSFSPELYKQGSQWPFYDKPDVANYSTFYRLPLGQPSSLEDQINANPGTFGYSEATHRFNLPPSSGQPDLTFFASRSTIDTGLNSAGSTSLLTSTNLSINQNNVEESPTVDQDIGSRLSFPLEASASSQSTFSAGLDFKTYQVINAKTNLFTFTQIGYNGAGVPDQTNVSTVDSPIPFTSQRIEYLPLSLRYDKRWQDAHGDTSFGLGLNVNLWVSGLTTISTPTTTYTTNSGVITTNQTTAVTKYHGVQSLQDITGTTESSGYWVVLTPSFRRDIVIDNWTTIIRVDGQWASEPLISPEQFGAGGINSVRGYPEGDVFGDDGWHLSLEQQTPPWVVGMIRDNTPLTLQASIYTDCADAILIDPQGGPPHQRLWGTGMGFTATAGSHWQARFLFSFPLRSTFDTQAYQPRFDFTLTAQF
jgi:hemolysin activation/secretion protein